MTPFLADPDFTLYQGDALEVLRSLQADSVHCCVTSPPYWGLRDYGTGTWEGGVPECDHAPVRGLQGTSDASQRADRSFTGSQPQGQVCSRCGACRIDDQLGLESTPADYVDAMVAVFAEVRRVLRPDGTCWLNIGDSYSSNPKGPGGDGSSTLTSSGTRRQRLTHLTAGRAPGLKLKDLVGVPWRVAFALQEDGWYLRSDIVWSKPNPMPESVTDRPTKAHEYLFLLTKSARYFYDADAISEPAAWERWGDQTVVKPQPGTASWIKPKSKSELTGGAYAPPGQSPHSNARKSKQELTGESRPGGKGDTCSGFNERYFTDPPRKTRNARTVWEIATQPYPDAHFAVFPEALPERCIKAGCPAGGTVLDPFMGSGTTALVARRLGRRSIGVELNQDYCALAARRLQQLSLLNHEMKGRVEI